MYKHNVAMVMCAINYGNAAAHKTHCVCVCVCIYVVQFLTPGRNVGLVLSGDLNPTTSPSM